MLWPCASVEGFDAQDVAVLQEALEARVSSIDEQIVELQRARQAAQGAVGCTGIFVTGIRLLTGASVDAALRARVRG